MSATRAVPGAPAGRAVKTAVVSSTAKRVLIALGVVTYLGATAAATAYGSAALYMLFHKQLPWNANPGITAGTMSAFWSAYGSGPAADPKERKKLQLALMVPPFVLLLLVPMGIAAATHRRRELHGSARFASANEIRDAGLLGGQGIIVGKYRGRFLTLPGKQSVMLSAPTRSGKGVGVVVPNLLAWQDSAVVVDIKSENWAITAGFRAAHGQAVYAWAPFAEDGRSHRWNPLSAIRLADRHVVGDTLAIAQVLYPTDVKGSGTEGFFNDTARNLFLGLALYLVETPELPRTIGEILRQSSGQGQPIKQYLQGLIQSRNAQQCMEGGAHPREPLSDACVDALMRFLSTSDNTLSSILATLNAPLTVFSNPLVDAATSGDDFSVADVRRKRMTVYVCIPPNRLADARVLLNQFFAQLINLNTAELPEHNPALKHQCLVLLDEFTALGRINILNAAVGYLAGYNLRLVTVIQAVSQLESVYGQHDARTFATNHAVQVLYAPREQRDANEYSEMLGTFTQQEKSRGRSNSSGAKGGGSSQSTNESSQRRALLLPQEFKELGLDRQVLILESCKPILADKIRYHTDPVFMERLMPPPALPELDLATHRARVEHRVRLAEDDEEFGLDQIAVDFHGLPHLGADASPEQVQSFVTGFFEALEVASAQTIVPIEQTSNLPSSPNPNLEPARAA
jgi:type IV secretion system protein VirD4